MATGSFGDVYEWRPGAQCKGYLMFGVINMPFVTDLKVCLSTLKVHEVIASVRTLHQPYESSVIKSEARIVLSAIIR
jgi:hypothetical protein